MRRLLTVAFGIFMAVTSASAQTGSRTAQERRDELAKVQEMLSDPDPMMRLANMETIVKAGDPVRTDVAIRSAFAGNDAALRGLAMRAYLATRREITFDIALPPGVRKDYDAAQDDPTRKRAFLGANRYIPFLERAGFKFRLTIARYEFPQDTGTLAGPGRATSPFTISGDKLSSLTNVGFGECYVDFAPIRKPAFEGTLTCKGGWPKLDIAAVPF